MKKTKDLFASCIKSMYKAKTSVAAVFLVCLMTFTYTSTIFAAQASSADSPLEESTSQTTEIEITEDGVISASSVMPAATESESEMPEASSDISDESANEEEKPVSDSSVAEEKTEDSASSDVQEDSTLALIEEFFRQPLTEREKEAGITASMKRSGASLPGDLEEYLESKGIVPRVSRAARAGGVVSWSGTSIPRQSPGGSGFKYYPTDSNDYIHAPSPYVVNVSVGEGSGLYTYIKLQGPNPYTWTFISQGSGDANVAYLNEKNPDPEAPKGETRLDNAVKVTGLSADDILYAVRYMNNGRYYMSRASVNGQTAYCVEPGLPSSSGESISGIDNNVGLTRKQQEVIGLIIYYADQMGAASDDAMYTVAQYMIWEIMNNALNYKDLSHNGSFMHIYDGGIKGRYESQYDALKAAVLEHRIIPSFLATKNTSPYIDRMSYVIPNTYTNGILKGNSLILQDKNGVVDKMNWPTNDPNFIYEVIDSTHLKITSRGNRVHDWQNSGIITKKGFEGIVNFGTLLMGDGKGGRQDLVTGKPLIDPLGGYMQLRTEGGAPGYELVKSDSEDGFVVGGNTGALVRLTFPDGHTEDVHLPYVVTTPGSYSMTELQAPKHDDQHIGYVLTGQTVSFSVGDDNSWEDTDAGGGAFIENKRQKGVITIQKADADDEYINHHNDYDANGLVENAKPQGDATLAGAEFTVRVHETIFLSNGDIAKGTDENGNRVELRKGVIVDRVITDANGRSTSRNDLELGIYEVQETKLPNGYQHLGYEPEGHIMLVDNRYTDEKTPINYHYVNYKNSVIKGHLSINKVLEGPVDNEATLGGNTPMKTPAEGVRFGVYLQSKQQRFGNGVVIIDKNGNTRTVTDKTKLPDDIFVVIPLNGSAPTMQKGADGKWYVINNDGTLSETSINPTDLFDVDPVITEDGYYKSLYMILETDSAGNASTRNPETILWVSYDGTTNVAPVTKPMPLPYGKYEVVELNAPEGYETVKFSFEIGYESFLNNPDDKGIVMTPETGYANGKVVENGKFGKDHAFSIEDKVVKQKIQVLKQDNETSKLIPLADTKFKLWHWFDTNPSEWAGTYRDEDVGNLSMGNWVSQQVYINGAPATTDVFATNSEGWFELPQPLVYGDYVFVEISAPHGYWLPDPNNTDVANVPKDENNNPQWWIGATDPNTGDFIWYEDAYGNTYQPAWAHTPFSVLDDGVAHNATEIIPIITIQIGVPNENQKGYLTLYKEGMRLVGNTSVAGNCGTLTQPKWELGGLPNAEYTITAATDIVTPDGTVRHNAGDVIQVLTTDINGKLVSAPMYLGEYLVEETKAPYGYVRDTTVYELNLEYQGQNVRIYPVHQEYTNVRQNVEFSVLKNREQAGEGTEATDLGSSTWLPANGIVFGLYAREDIMAIDGSVALAADAHIECVTIVDGKGVSTLELPIGKYYLKEIKTNEDLVLDDTEYDIEFKYTADDKVYDDEGNFIAQAGTGTGETVIEVKLGDGVIVKNYLKRGGVELIKSDAEFPNGSAGAVYLEGAEFTIYDATNTARAIIVTDVNGKGRVSNLPYGKYTMRETKAPEGYKLNPSVWEIIIDEDGKVLAYDITDEVDNPIAKVKKVDQHNNPVAGAVFVIEVCTNYSDVVAYREAYTSYMTEYEQYVAAYEQYKVDLKAAAENGLPAPTEPIAPTKPQEVVAQWEVYKGAAGNKEYRYTTNSLGMIESGYLEDGHYRLVETSVPSGYVGAFSKEFDIEAATMARPRVIVFEAVNYKEVPTTPEEPTNRYGRVDFSFGGRGGKGFPQTGGVLYNADVIKETLEGDSEGSVPDESDFEKTIQKDGKTYELSTVTYGTVDMTETVDYSELEEKSVPQTYTVTKDGKSYELDLIDVTYKETGVPEKIDYEHDFGYLLSEPKAPAVKTVTITDEGTGEEREVEVSLVSLEKVDDYAWQPVQIQSVFYGDAGVSGFLFEGSTIPYDAATPVWQGYEDAVLQYLNLDARYYRIVGAKWTDADFTDINGESGRRAVYYAECYSARWVGQYAAEQSVEQYAATATYSLSGVKNATATYVLADTGLSTIQVVLLVGVVLLVITVVVILLVIAKRRKAYTE